jgi:hypothetical protein
MVDGDENRGMCKRLGAQDQRWSSTGRVLGGQTIERSGDDVWGLHVHKETRSVGFLV